MAFELDVRVGVFPLLERGTVHQPDQALVLPPEWQQIFAKSDALAAVQWSAASSLGPPVAPYIVQRPRRPIPWRVAEQGPQPGDVRLDLMNGFSVSFMKFVSSLDVGLLYIRVEVATAAAPVDVFAVDISGSEVSGSRQRVEQRAALIFAGPGVVGLEATGPLDLSGVRLCDPSQNWDISWETLAEVAPSIGAVGVYRQQAYLASSLDWYDAMTARLLVDALARQNTAPPSNRDLEAAIHRADPLVTADTLLRTSGVNAFGSNFQALITNPDWAYAEELVSPGRAPLPALLKPVSLLQLLAASGPVEACVLGASVVVPGPYTDALSQGNLLAAFNLPNGPLPIPVVRVIGFFRTDESFRDTGDVAENRTTSRHVATFARLLGPAPPQAPLVHTLSVVAPAARDSEAHADVEIAFGVQARLDVHFLGQVRGEGDVELRHTCAGVPKGHLAVDVESTDPSRPLCRVLDTHVPLPLAAEEAAQYEIHTRDCFGRWSQSSSGACALAPWPVCPPALLSADVVYTDDGAVLLNIVVAWNWTLRSPREIRFGLAVGSNDAEPSLASLLPSDGATAPDLGVGRRVAVLFDEQDQNVVPRIESDGTSQPGGTSPTVAVLPDTTPEQTEGGEVFEPGPLVERSYLVTIPIGPASVVFATSEACRVAVIADATETVSGVRRSVPSKRLFQTMLDPRPPRIDRSPWSPVWASDAGVDGKARATLACPRTSGAHPHVVTAWRAHESSVIELVLSERPDLHSAVSVLRTEREMDVRVELLRGLCEQLDASREEFRGRFISLFSAGPSAPIEDGFIELALPAGQTGIELVLLSVLSKTGVPSDKAELSHVRALVVPKNRPRTKPSLQIVAVDDHGVFETTGCVMLIVGSNETFGAENVRVFWDDRDESPEADDLLFRLAKVTPLSLERAREYIADIDAMLERESLPYRRMLLAFPNQGWSQQHFAVDIKAIRAIPPHNEAPSPRSAVVSCVVVPRTRPQLVLTERRRTPSGSQWRVRTMNLPATSFRGLGPSEIYVEFEATATVYRGLRPLNALREAPIELHPPDGLIDVRCDESGDVVVTTEFVHVERRLVLSARDPMRRKVTLSLSSS